MESVGWNSYRKQQGWLDSALQYLGPLLGRLNEMAQCHSMPGIGIIRYIYSYVWLLILAVTWDLSWDCHLEYLHVSVLTAWLSWSLQVFKMVSVRIVLLLLWNKLLQTHWLKTTAISHSSIKYISTMYFNLWLFWYWHLTA